MADDGTRKSAGDSAAIPTLADVRSAAGLIAGAVLRTPFLPAPRLSALTGASVFVKYENLQATCAFKERGALVKLLSLSADDRRRGVIAMSAGNHAQGVAYHGGRLGVPVTIVMPRFTPYVKVAATRAFGATVLLEGETVAESQLAVDRIRAKTGAIQVHPFDDPDVIRGQGTIGLEVAEDEPNLDAFLVPVGGGGLISGVAIAMKALCPRTEIVGVETELYPSMWAALRGETPQCGGDTLAEGIAVKTAGKLPLAIARRLVDDIILVSEDLIERAVATFLNLQKTMAEGAGAAELAALLAQRERFAGKKVGLLLCGGNIDPRLAGSIMVRDLARSGRIVAIRLTILDRPGVLASVSRIIGEADANVLEVDHHRTTLDVPAKGARLHLTIETHGPEHTDEIIAALLAEGHMVERVGSG